MLIINKSEKNISKLRKAGILTVASSEESEAKVGYWCTSKEWSADAEFCSAPTSCSRVEDVYTRGEVVVAHCARNDTLTSNQRPGTWIQNTSYIQKHVLHSKQHLTSTYLSSNNVSENYQHTLELKSSCINHHATWTINQNVLKPPANIMIASSGIEVACIDDRAWLRLAVLKVLEFTSKISAVCERSLEETNFL
jgi:hypothetical protein